MYTIMDYLNWRGDLTFKNSPFNDIDALILSYFIYTEIEELNINKPISIEKTSELFFKKFKKEDILKKKSMTKKASLLLEKMAKTNRFKDLIIHDICFNLNKEIETQFMASCIDIDDFTTFISFRGTDETLVGWKEDFNMTFLDEIPGQTNAINYLNNLNLKNKKIYIGGHSKGGNLSIYSIINTFRNLKNNLIKVYNFDGPGLSNKMINSKEYLELSSKINLILPNTSIIGRLFEHKGNIKIISSNANNLYDSHDAMLWNVMGNDFVTLDSFSQESSIIVNAVTKSFNKMELYQKRDLINSIFKIIDDCEIVTVNDFSISWEKLSKAIKSSKKISEETKEVFWNFIKTYIELNSKYKKENKNKDA